MEPIVNLAGLFAGIALFVMVVGMLELRLLSASRDRTDWQTWKSLEMGQQHDTEAWTDFTVWKTRYAAPRRFQWGRAFLAASMLWSVATTVAVVLHLAGMLPYPAVATLARVLVGVVALVSVVPAWLHGCESGRWGFKQIIWEIWRRSPTAQHAPRQTRESFAVWDYLRRRGQL